jgi:hypothetical protein
MYFRTGSHKSRGNRNVFLKPALIAAKAEANGQWCTATNTVWEAVTGGFRCQREEAICVIFLVCVSDLILQSEKKPFLTLTILV